MHTLRQLLEGKAPEIHAVAPGDSVFDAVKLMAEKSIGAVLVMDGSRLAGIISERDYARKVVLHGRSSSDTSVREIMTADVITVDPRHTVEQCMQVVTENRIRHLPVVEDEVVIGVISIGDLVKAVIEDQKTQLDQLQRYIAS
ncbi:MAG: CBS domain-containing protein [Pseudoxanthomonas sp.]